MPRQFLAAVHVFFVRGGQVLLLRRFNTGYEDGNYGVPAGHLDSGETVVQAAVREAREEVGVTLAPADVAVVGVMHRNTIPYIRRVLANHAKGVWFEEFGW